MSDAMNTPLPVEPLGYAQERQDSWLTIIRALSLAAIVLCAAKIFASMLQIVMAFAGGRVPWRFPAMASLEGLFLSIELGGNVAAAAMLGGAIGARTLRPWSRALVMWGAIGLIVLTGFTWVWSTIQLISYRGINPWYARPLMIVQYSGSMVMQMMLPAVLVWLMRRSEVRRRFEGQAV